MVYEVLSSPMFTYVLQATGQYLCVTLVNCNWQTKILDDWNFWVQMVTNLVTNTEFGYQILSSVHRLLSVHVVFFRFVKMSRQLKVLFYDNFSIHFSKIFYSKALLLDNFKDHGRTGQQVLTVSEKAGFVWCKHRLANATICTSLLSATYVNRK